MTTREILRVRVIISMIMERKSAGDTGLRGDMQLLVKVPLMTVAAELHRPRIRHLRIRHLRIRHPRIRHLRIRHLRIRHPRIRHLRIRHLRIRHLRIRHLRIRHLRIRHPRIRHLRIRHLRIRHPRIRHLRIITRIQVIRTIMVEITAGTTGAAETTGIMVVGQQYSPYM
jgi:hypothetical protein